MPITPARIYISRGKKLSHLGYMRQGAPRGRHAKRRKKKKEPDEDCGLSMLPPPEIEHVLIPYVDSSSSACEATAHTTTDDALSPPLPPSMVLRLARIGRVFVV